MLQAMRDRILGWLGWVVIGLIIITFAAFGLSSYLQDKSRVYAAKVNDTEIAPRELQRAYQQQRNRLQRSMGDAFDPQKIDDTHLRKQALETLIRERLMFLAAKHDGYAISDQYLGAYLRSIPALQEDGEFSKERYESVLFNQGLSQAAFEADVRKQLEIGQWVEGFSRTAFVTESEIKTAYNLYKQKRDFSYLVIPAETVGEQVEISEAEARQYYDEHADDYVTPERIRLDYLRLKRSDIAAEMKVDEAALATLYEERKRSLTKQEKRRASHILIQLASDADEEAVAAARAKADELKARLDAGERLESLAKTYSDDPGSKEQGGDLGYFAKGDMVPAFDEAVFGMEVGQISDPVRSQFGFHIIRLDDIQASEIPSLDEVRPELEAELKNREAGDVFYDRLERLTNLTFENPQTLEPAADDLGLTIQESDWLTAQGGPGIGEYRDLMGIVFGEDVLEAGNNSEPVEVGADDMIVARLKDREQPKPQPFEEVRPQIEKLLKSRKTAERLAEKGGALLERARGGEALDQIAQGEELTLQSVKAVTRDNRDHEQKILRQAFRMSRPDGPVPSLTGLTLPNGDFVVLQLEAVEDVNVETIPEQDKQTLKSAFLVARQSSDVSLMTEYLHDAAEIVIPDEESQ
jgi:peptidyl-prolyl cis-trans isomerase D